MNKKRLAFDKNGYAFVWLLGTIRGASAGRLLENRRRGTNDKKTLRQTMKRIVMLSIAVMAVSALSASAADAKANYEKDCAKCHGTDGKGETKMGKKYNAKDYTSAKVQEELKDDAAVKAIKEGYKDKEGKVVMKPAEGLSDDDIKALVAYMRKFKK
jgi:cytochrome c553